MPKLLTVFTWDTATLFATRNVVFPLFGKVDFPLLNFARGCAGFTFLRVFICPTFRSDARSIGARRGIASSDIIRHYIFPDGRKWVLINPGTKSLTILSDERGICPLNICTLCNHSGECSFQDSSTAAMIYVILRRTHPLYFG
jgi:hypothetical protein